MASRDGGHKISAVILAWNRKPFVEIVLDRLAQLPVDEIIVVDHGDDGTAEMVDARGGNARAVHVGENTGIAGRNLGAKEASGDLLVMLDDDAYPLPGAIEKMVEVMDAHPRTAILGGLVQELDAEGNIFRRQEAGTFDWFLRAGEAGPTPSGGFPSFYFPEGACMARRAAFLEVGGYFEPFFTDVTELELTTRLIDAGWDVRYLPEAVFDHMRTESGLSVSRELEHRVRNQFWYFWMYFPQPLAAWRMISYAFFEFFDCIGRGALGAWFKAIGGAWRKRSVVRPYRRTLSREVLHRTELNRTRMQWKLLLARFKKIPSKLSGRG
jgi:N-acetylglucosaminyl-diphospho-decaprenol L-rhamnosyltransferase